MYLNAHKESKMKIVYLVLLAGVLMFSVAEAGDEPMSERAQALMSALNVKEASSKELRNRRKGALSEQKFKKAGGLVVSHKTDSGDGNNGSPNKLVFSDHNGNAKAFGKIKYAKSARAAQSALFEELAMNSLPLDLLLKLYGVKKDGPGDFCIVRKSFDNEKKRFVVDESQVICIRGNVVISVYAKDASVRAEELARIMDEKLVAEQ